MLIKRREKAHFAHSAGMKMENFQAFARSAVRKTKLKIDLIGKAIQVHPVRLSNNTPQNPPIVIIGTKGTMIRLIKTPVKFVCPIKKRRIGKVPRVAPSVGNP